MKRKKEDFRFCRKCRYYCCNILSQRVSILKGLKVLAHISSGKKVARYEMNSSQNNSVNRHTHTFSERSNLFYSSNTFVNIENKWKKNECTKLKFRSQTGRYHYCSFCEVYFAYLRCWRRTPVRYFTYVCRLIIKRKVATLSDTEDFLSSFSIGRGLKRYVWEHTKHRAGTL